MSVIVRKIFFISLSFFLSFSCSNEKDEKGPIEDRIAGGKLLAKIVGSNKHFVLLNTNNYNKYSTGSLHIYDREAASDDPNASVKPLFVMDIPSFASTISVSEQYIFISFEAENAEKSATLGVWEYILGDDGVPVISANSQMYLLEKAEASKPDEESGEKFKPEVVPLNSLIKGDKFVLTCKGGELFVMDLTDPDFKNWKPSHVRDYGKYALREALVATEDGFLLLFPAFSKHSSSVSLTALGSDKKELVIEGTPKSQRGRLATLKEQTSPYQLVVYDLMQRSKYKQFTDVYADEGFWLSFNLEGSEATELDHEFFRTNFYRVRKSSDDESTFYLSKRTSLLNERSQHQILKLKVESLADFRNTQDKSTYDLMAQLKFEEKPLFVKENEEKKSLAEDAKEHRFYDFEPLFVGENPYRKPSFVVVSYNYSSKHYFLLAGKEDSVETLYSERETKKAYWELLVWDNKNYVTVKDSYKEGKLIFGEISL